MFLFILSGKKHFEVLNCQDPDGDELGLTITQEPFLVNVEIDGETLIITAPNQGYFDDFILACFDVWGDFAEISVFVEFGIIGVSTENRINVDQLNLLPNPATDFIKMDLSAFGGQIITAQIYTMGKKVIWQEEITPCVNFKIGLNDFTSGNYLLFLKGEDKFAAFPFVKM